MALFIDGKALDGKDGMHHYSTEEQVIGTWIDGSTLYEKTIVETINLAFSSQTEIIDLTDCNIDNLVGFFGSRFEADGNIIVGEAALYLLYNETSKKILAMQRYSERVINGTIHIVLRYTKSST